ncbi:MAG: ankyrin repeat domain-containing protein, partial [Chromatiales bacterium]|nr:ankyrin repeat domain-containing protein [Chromatiales bacterium]
SKGYMKTMKQFLKAGADPDIKDKDGDTALHLAANEGRYSTVEALLQYGASPNLRNRKGQTASDLGKGYKKTSAALAAYGGRTNKKRSSSFGKIFATVAVAGIAGSANISANNRAKVMSATVNDIWVKDGKGKQLSNMYQKSLQDSSPARSNNPTVREMMNTRSQQQSASAIYNEEMKKYQEIIKQQKLKQRKPSLYQQQLNRIASQTNSKNQKNTSANTVIPVNPTQSRLNSNASSKPRNSNTSVAYNPTNTSQPSGRSQADKCTTFTPPLSTHPLPILTSKGIDHLRSDGAEPTLLRKANEHMTRTCGNKNFSVGRQIRPTWNREIIEKRRFFDKVELTLKDGQTFSCLCTPKKVNRTPGRGVAR